MRRLLLGVVVLAADMRRIEVGATGALHSGSDPASDPDAVNVWPITKPAVQAPCPAGQMRGAPECWECPPGTYSTQHDGLPEQWICEECDPGHFSSGRNSLQCTACPAGSYQEKDGATSCVPCFNGFFGATPGSRRCERCPAGSVQKDQGATGCDLVNEGYFQDWEGQLWPKKCPPGSFAQGSGSVTCEACATGTYQPDENAAACLSCPAGSFADETGRKKCDLCDAGHFAGVAGMDECTECPDDNESYSPGEGAIACLKCDQDYLNATFVPNSFKTTCCKEDLWLSHKTCVEPKKHKENVHDQELADKNMGITDALSRFGGQPGWR